ncbi:MAG: T9SS type A sorting domain-containing protein [Rhizobacter sp.]|nr:T9SS type A sorting domain-containing protein [Chlorobiales bacterium]
MALPRGAALRKGNAAASTNGFGSAVAVGVGGTILRSADASAWSLVSSNTTASLYGVAVSPDFSTVAAKGNGVSATQGFGSAVAVGVGGTILRSADGGTSWQSVSSSNTSTLLSVAVASNFSGAASKSNGSQSVSGLGSAIAVGVGGTILRSADGGTNWQSISSNVSAALNSISLSTDFSTVAAKGNGALSTQGFGSAVAVGVGGTILRSADGGANWVNVSSSVTNLDNITAPLTTDLLSVEFVDETIGYACGKNGVILQTNDGGLSWRQQPSGTTADINDIAVSANGTGNAVGSGTTALITNNGGNPVLSVSAPGAPVPPGFALRQNYPNPFNPNTLISYQLSMNSQVQLKVYDVLGREVASLVDARQATGDYLVNFNATKLSSGVYFYRLTTGNFVQTKKMLLLK